MSDEPTGNEGEDALDGLAMLLADLDALVQDYLDAEYEGGS